MVPHLGQFLGVARVADVSHARQAHQPEAHVEIVRLVAHVHLPHVLRMIAVIERAAGV